MKVYIIKYEINRLVGRYGTIEEYEKCDIKRRVLAPNIDAVKKKYKRYNKLSVSLDKDQVVELEK